MTTQFLVRPPPLPGESLSSWRQRAGLANGFTQYPLAPRENRRCDPDLGPPQATVEWLANAYGRSIEEVERMSFQGAFGRSFASGRRRSRQRGVVPLRYSRRDQAFGSPFCPECLKEDAEPYHRLKWRLSMSPVCSRHSALLIDLCASCGEPGWNAPTLKPVEAGAPARPVHICANCGFDLRSSPSKAIDASPYERFLTSEPDQTVRLAETLRVPAGEYLSAVWVVCQLLLRTRSRTRILARATAEANVVGRLPSTKGITVDALDLPQRHLLAAAVHGQFGAWPTKMVEFCERHGLTAEAFSQDRKMLPKWFSSVVSTSLSRQKRGLSQDAVGAACLSLSRSKSPVCVASVSQKLGAVDCNPIHRAVGRRGEATEDEAIELACNLRVLARGNKRRRSTSEMRVRDALILLFSLLSGSSVGTVSQWSEAEAQSQRFLISGRATAQRARAAALDCLGQVLDAHDTILASASPRRKRAVGKYFAGFRCEAASERGAKKLLTEAMLGLDHRLQRSTSAFVRTLAATGGGVPSTSSDRTGSPARKA